MNLTVRQVSSIVEKHFINVLRDKFSHHLEANHKTSDFFKYPRNRNCCLKLLHTER
jgi:hypothetical protein